MITPMIVNTTPGSTTMSASIAVFIAVRAPIMLFTFRQMLAPKDKLSKHSGGMPRPYPTGRDVVLVPSTQKTCSSNEVCQRARNLPLVTVNPPGAALFRIFHPFLFQELLNRLFKHST